MAWFRNHYECYRCGSVWEDEWSCVVDDECPACGARHVVAHDSNDLTYVIVGRGGHVMVLRSRLTAEHAPDYEEVMMFLERDLAQAYIDAVYEQGFV